MSRARIPGLRSRILYPNGLFDLGSFQRNPRDLNEQAIRSLCTYAPMSNNEAVARVLGRYKIFVDLQDDSHSSHLMLDGYWETWVTETIVSLVTRGMVVADIGANLGYFSLLMADLVGPEGRVHSFEANRHLAGKLVRSLSINGFEDRAFVHQVALGEKDGERVVFSAPEREPKNGRITPLELPFDRSTLLPGARVMETKRLDSREDWREIELAKIDVEGAEQAVWRGAAGLLESNRLKTVILEYAQCRCDSPAGFLDEIEAYGFSLGIITYDDGVRPTDQAEILAGNPYEDVMLILRR